MTQTMNGNVRAQRKSLATEIDRLDNILDGLAEALNESVADAVRDVVGEVVKETVEASIKEVLNSPDLLRSALARHIPEVDPIPEKPRRSLTDVLKACLVGICEKACHAASKVKKAAGGAWAWCLGKLRNGLSQVIQGCRQGLKLVGVAPVWLWRYKKVATVALGAGTLVAAGAYVSGPVIASALCGLSSAALTVASMVLWPFWRLLTAHSADG